MILPPGFIFCDRTGPDVVGGVKFGMVPYNSLPDINGLLSDYNLSGKPPPLFDGVVKVA